MASLTFMAQEMLSPLLLLSIFMLLPTIAIGAAQLKTGFYSESCPGAEARIREVIHRAMVMDPRNAASVIRIQFHDCFVNGCDASLLLDDTPDMLGEKLSSSNINSLRSYEVIDEAKEEVEMLCPGVVSCADIITIAARDAVFLVIVKSGGPHWEVKLGREDSLTASQEASNSIFPGPRANASKLINLFQQFNLSITDLVALFGAHSIGKARCVSMVFRLYNQSGIGQPDPTIDPSFRSKLNRLCPKGGDGNVTGGLDATPVAFDNQYFKDLVRGRGFLKVDQTLFADDGRTRKVVQKFSIDQDAFFSAFVEGMVKMGDLKSASPGEIRRNCRVANSRLDAIFLESIKI